MSTNKIAKIAAIDARLDDFHAEINRRFENQNHLTDLAIQTVDRSITVAQETASRAVMKAEAAAERALLDAQVAALRREIETQIIAQKDAMNAALMAAKEALLAALSSSDRAISKAEEAAEKRFAGINEFRGQLADQQHTFVTRTEVDLRAAAIDSHLDRNHAELTEWRRTVDAALVAAQSKSSMIYSVIAIAISIGMLLIGVYNLFTKAPVTLN